MKINLKKILSRIIFSFGLIYGIDVLLNGVGIHIPINLVTLLMTSILGVPGVLCIIAIFYLI